MGLPTVWVSGGCGPRINAGNPRHLPRKLGLSRVRRHSSATGTTTEQQQYAVKTEEKEEEEEYDFFGKRVLCERRRQSSRQPVVLDHGDMESGLEDQDKGGQFVLRSKEERLGAWRGGGQYRVENAVYRIVPEYEQCSMRQRASERKNTLSILVMDEGGEIRARLAGAMLVYMFRNLRRDVRVHVEVVSLGPPTHDVASIAMLERMVRTWMKNDEEALDIARRFPRQFREVQDPVESDMILVMDRYDLQETMREVSVLDAVSPGNFYSSRVKMIAPFAAHISRRDIPVDIPDPLYQEESRELLGLSKDLAFCCKGVVDMVYGIHEFVIKDKAYLKARDALQQILRCPGLWMELPYTRSRRPDASAYMVSQYSARNVNGRRIIAKRISKERGYWKDVENVANELRAWMQENSVTMLPTQAMLRQAGACSLASSIDYHGGIHFFASKLGLKSYKRRPNGFWSNIESVRGEIQEYVTTQVGDDGVEQLIMPTAQDLLEAGRSDIVRAVRLHGGFHKVALSIGAVSHRSRQWEEAEILKMLSNLNERGHEVCRKTVREMNMDGLESAIDRLGGFPYFIQLLDEEHEMCVVHLSSSDAWSSSSSEEPVCDQLQCPVPYIQKVATKVRVWMASKGLSRRLPTRKELENANRVDIWRGIQRAGGLQKLSEYMHVEFVETRGRKKTKKKKVIESTQVLLDSWNAYEDFVLID